jgi:hypothetical protein
MSECKADAEWPALLLKQAVGSLEYDQFRTKKNDGPFYPLRGHNTRTLAGIFGVNRQLSQAVLTGRALNNKDIQMG